MNRYIMITLVAIVVLLAGCGDSAQDAATVAEGAQYTCPMHPSVRLADPDAPCPMCGMDLVAVESESVSHYTCPMHPSVRSEDPDAPCPMCGMDLVASGSEEQSEAGIHVSETRRQQAGIRTEPASMLPLNVTVRAAGEVTYDETRVHDVVLKVEGWVEQLKVDRTGQWVDEGQTLFTLYSPELYSAQRELLQVRASGNQTLVETAENRLRLWGMSDNTIGAVIRRGEPMLNVPIAAPAAGYIVDKAVVEGAHVHPSSRLFRIAALDRVWVEASVFESDIASVKPGMPASITLRGVPGVELAGSVDFVYPFMEDKTRTGRIRVELDNADGRLKPGMYADVTLNAELGNVLQVPETAVIFTGPHRLVFVEAEAEHLVPREVKIGRRSDGRYEILAGLDAGERVVTTGSFLVASESRISAALDRWEGASDGQHNH